MALDTSLISYFMPGFLVIFLWVLLYAFLQKSKYITDNGNLNSILALVLSLLTVQFSGITKVIAGIIPFFVFGVFVIFIFTFIFTSAGYKGLEKVKTPASTWIIIIVCALIVLWVGGNVWGNTLLSAGNQNTQDGGIIAERPTNTTDFQTNLINTVFNPKVAGALLLIGAIALIILFIGEGQK